MANSPTLRTGGVAERGWGTRPFLSFRDINQLFDDMLRGSLPGPQNGSTGMIMPQIDVSETDNELRVKAELPGVTEKDVEVTLSDDVLVIRGEKKFERKEERENYHFAERAYGTFQRTLRLPFEADPSKVKATFENGVLTVTVPKDEKTKDQSHRIEVQQASASNNGGNSSQSSESGRAGQSAVKAGRSSS